MRVPNWLVSGLVLASLVSGSVLVGAVPPPLQPGASIDWQAKIDPWILEAGTEGETEFLVYLAEQAGLKGAATLKTKEEKGAYVFDRLTEVARRTQPPLLSFLREIKVNHRPYWIANMIWVRGDLHTVQTLARRIDVGRLYANPTVRFDLPRPASSDDLIGIASPTKPEGVEWNIHKVNADVVWSAGFTGQGVVVGGQDTGYDWEHPALKDKYRGWEGSMATHDYNWHDAIHNDDPKTPPGNPCGFNSPVPCDDGYHGTHTMGIIVGDDGTGNRVGMAPGARWIGCRNMEQGWGTPATYAECYQWFLAPTDLYGENPRLDLAPDVINNSWSCPPEEGCTDPQVLLTVVENVRAAGILTVQSAGNSGPSCATIDDPAAIYEASFTVGNTTVDDTIASSSSRGPVTVDGSGRLKPDVSAPGTFVRSSVTGGGYMVLSGTSMAGPHVAGLAALLISAQLSLAGQVDEIETIIERSSVHLGTSEACGSTAGQVPNNVFGWGRIDALAAWVSLDPEGKMIYLPHINMKR